MERNINECAEILKVFRDSERDSWKNNPDALMYLMELCSAGLERLHQEPDRLNEEKTSISELTQDLAFHNYKTFIQTAECSHDIFQDFNIIESRLESVLHKLPIFSENCNDFSKKTQVINLKWYEASLMLSKCPQLLEFLEMPQLMDTYARNGYYEEALELASYVKRLERKHSTIYIVKNIVNDVQNVLNVMLLQLITQLRANIQLPACLKIVGFFRRMDVFNELELRIKFLQARGSWFQENLNKISKNDAYQHIRKVIECYRTHLFDIITQYRAIFADDDPLLLATKDCGESEVAVFQSWIILRISEFLIILKKDLKADLGGRIDSVYSQCMYFGLSFSRVGIDFRSFLISVFEEVMLFNFFSAIDNASKNFEKAMQSYTVTSYSLTTFTSTQPPFFTNQHLQPPSSLLDFYPLAQYCNSILSALNDVKLCASFSFYTSVIKILQDSLLFVAETIISYYKTELEMMTENEKELFFKFCHKFVNEFVPHLYKCITVLFPPEELVNILGLTPLEFNRIESLFCLNKNIIFERMKHILPSKDEDDDVGIQLTIKTIATDDDIDQITCEENIKPAVNSSELDGVKF